MRYATPQRRIASLFNGQRPAKRFGLNRSLLPSPLEYLAQHDLRLKNGSGDWRLMLCPFHDDTTASLSFSVKKGAFKCFACGAKGGDLIAFHMQRHSLQFIDACKDLGVWEMQS